MQRAYPDATTTRARRLSGRAYGQSPARSSAHTRHAVRLDANTNARQLAEKDPHPAENFDEYVRRYADNFILDEEKEEFIDWHLCANMKRRLLHEEKFTYHYHSVSKEGKDSYYEAYVVKGKTDDETFNAFLDIAI